MVGAVVALLALACGVPGVLGAHKNAGVADGEAQGAPSVQALLEVSAKRAGDALRLASLTPLDFVE